MTEGSPTHFAPLLDDDPTRIGPYRLIGRVGAGGMGTVFAAQGQQRGHYVAVKVVLDQLATDPEFRARFAREVDLVRRVRSPCVPEFRGADTQNTTAWLATDYIPGPTLREYVRQHGALTGGKLLALAAGLAEALHAIHDQQIVHRDLKPGNVILAPTGPKVLDFGIARAVEETALTRTGGAVGTAGWISPEQYGSGELTERSDLFSWGALVAFAATGREPFGTGAPNALAYRVRQADPDLDGIPGELRPLVEAALAKDPAARPSAAAALRRVEQLWGDARAQGIGAGQDPAAAVTTLLNAEWTGMDTAPPKPPRGRRRRTLLVAGAAVAALVIVGGGVFAAPDAVNTLTGGDGGSDNGQAGDGEGGHGDDDGSSGGNQADDAGGGDEGQDDDPPDAAVAEVEQTSSAGPERATAQVGAAQGNLALFRVDNTEIAQTDVSVSNAQHNGDGVEFTVSVAHISTVSAAQAFDQEAFSVFADGRELTPDEEFRHEPPESSEHDPEEQFTYTLSVPEAPESGLLAFRAGMTDGEELPPVGICYDAASDIFTTEYQECT